jgi:HPt (histidine-containing phosphotransfer) domain-containing protein
MLMETSDTNSPDCTAFEVGTERAERCPELEALTDLLGSAEAAGEVVTLLIEVTHADIGGLDQSIASADLDQATLHLHRIVGGYHILGPSLLSDEGSKLLAELRTQRNDGTLERISRYRDRVLALTARLEQALARQQAPIRPEPTAEPDIFADPHAAPPLPGN